MIENCKSCSKNVYDHSQAEAIHCFIEIHTGSDQN